MARELIIFDWDGTLMDSTARIVDCMQAAARDLALDSLPDTAVRQIIGLGLPQAIASLYPALSPADVERMRASYATHFVAAERVPNPLFDGVEGMITGLRDSGMLLAVATGKSRQGLTRVWDSTGHGRWFHASRCADETRSKPHPDMVHELLAEFSVTPDAALVVGDTTHDLVMAANAGVDAIGVTWGAHEKAQLAGASPLALVEGIDELVKLLSKSAQEIA